MLSSSGDHGAGGDAASTGKPDQPKLLADCLSYRREGTKRMLNQPHLTLLSLSFLALSIFFSYCGLSSVSYIRHLFPFSPCSLCLFLERKHHDDITQEKRHMWSTHASKGQFRCRTSLAITPLNCSCRISDMLMIDTISAGCKILTV